MHNRKVYRTIADRLVVVVLSNQIPDLSEEGITHEEESIILEEYEKIIQRLIKLAEKKGGKFNRYLG